MNLTSRIALLTNAPAPYRAAFFNELAERCHLLIVFDTNREPDRDWLVDESEFNFDWLVTRGFDDFTAAHPWPVCRPQSAPNPVYTKNSILERFLPDVVVSSGLGVRTIWAALFLLCALSPPYRVVGRGSSVRRNRSCPHVAAHPAPPMHNKSVGQWG